MKYILLTVLSCICLTVVAQNVDTKLSAAIKSLETDAQFKHAILSMYVVDSKTGKVVFDKNAQVGLAPASCQKVVTSVSAFELLGKGYRYKTSLYLDTNASNLRKFDTYRNYTGIIIVRGNGDPTLGSFRYKETNDFLILNKWSNAIKKLNIGRIQGALLFEDVEKAGDINTLPDGYIWQDIGNYYASMSSLINWRENQYDIIFRSSKPGDKTEIISVNPEMPNLHFNNLVFAGAKGSGDNAYIYCAPYADTAYVKGTIPPEEKQFSISGSMPNPSLALNKQLSNVFKNSKISIDVDPVICFSLSNWKYNLDYDKYAFELKESIHFSPKLDSINYWFLKKSVNLYGESLVKTIGKEKGNIFSTDSGIAIIKNFWQKKGIEPSALNIIDGSGLSPANRVTTNALVTVMQYAQQQQWFASFYYALPEMNGIKMKDGYINGVRSYTGYIKSKTGNEYTFSFIVNNFDGSPGTVREKMWKVLDMLK
jgi:serine-type D-Ala-D-Ala carboxypeptidase/endopeptidase (penicillin-binding protein 4)